MQLLSNFARLAGGAAVGLLVAVACTAGPAWASDRWEEAGSGAVAILPVPLRASIIQGGSLACAQQRWTLRLRTEKRPDAAGMATVDLAVDGRNQTIDSRQSPTLVEIPVDRATIERLKQGSSFAVRVGIGKEAPNASFSLRNSRNAIDTVAPRCSPVNMEGFDNIALVEYSPDAAIAEPLLADEIRLFRQATSSTPRIAAARLDRGGGRELLFASLCGSSWYYGRSGCTLFGYARTSAAAVAEWREVYHSEGMGLYVDKNGEQEGWPNIATLQVDGTEAIHWRWDGSRYEMRSSDFAAEELKGSIVTP
jgi:hypothetical protein